MLTRSDITFCSSARSAVIYTRQAQARIATGVKIVCLHELCNRSRHRHRPHAPCLVPTLHQHIPLGRDCFRLFNTDTAAPNGVRSTASSACDDTVCVRGRYVSSGLMLVGDMEDRCFDLPTHRNVRAFRSRCLVVFTDPFCSTAPALRRGSAAPPCLPPSPSLPGCITDPGTRARCDAAIRDLDGGRPDG